MKQLQECKLIILVCQLSSWFLILFGCLHVAEQELRSVMNICSHFPVCHQHCPHYNWILEVFQTKISLLFCGKYISF